jgi:nickel transport protein
MMRRKAHALLIACLVAFVWGASAARAHKVSLFAYVQGDAIVVEGFFGGKAKAMDCGVEVFDQQGAKLKEGKTDSKGIFSFPIADLGAASGPIRFVLTAGMGHLADYTLPASDLPSEVKTAGSSHASSVEKATPEEHVPEKSAAVQGIRTQDTAAIKKMVEDAVKAQLEPVVTMLGSQQKLLLEQKDKSPSIPEIIGGIGWIFGIVGVWAYFAGRRPMAK